MNILEERGITSTDMIFTAFTCYQSVRMCMCVFSPAFASLNTALCRYFLQGCATEDPIIQLYKYDDYIQSSIGLADQFLAKANEVGIDEINEFCGADVTPFIERIGLIKVSLELLLGALRYVN